MKINSKDVNSTSQLQSQMETTQQKLSSKPWVRRTTTIPPSQDHRMWNSWKTPQKNTLGWTSQPQTWTAMEQTNLGWSNTRSHCGSNTTHLSDSVTTCDYKKVGCDSMIVAPAFVLLAVILLCYPGGCRALDEQPVRNSMFNPSVKWIKMQGKQDFPVRKIVVETVKNVSEDVKPNTVLANFHAYAILPGDLQGTNYIFTINRTTDEKRQFIVDQSGTVKVAKPLDREMISEYRLGVEVKKNKAKDTGYVILHVNVEDVNDNAPSLYTSRPSVIMENSQQVQFVAEVFGKDPDTRANGPPFTMKVPANSPFLSQFDMTFSQDGDNGNGSMKVTTKVTFDRESNGEAGKILMLPIIISDNGTDRQQATRYLPVIIGDENDNRMYDGTKRIHVFNYKGKMPRSNIGGVHVEDLDDWDLGDKSFSWKSGKPAHFDLGEAGSIIIEEGTGAGTYEFQVNVFDNERQEDAVGTVIVTVEELAETAFKRSGSIRIRSTSAEDFIRVIDGTSKYQRFQSKLADLLNLPQSQVQVFSIMPQEAEPPIVDVRFAAYGSPYHFATQLNGMVELHRNDFEKIVGVDIVQVRVDECIWETCDYGCTTVETADTNPTVISANSTGFVGVTTNTSRLCQCPSEFIPDKCGPNTCHNGGICHNTYPGFFCECRDQLYKGPRCEAKTRGFTGNGWSWLTAIGACSLSHISLEFMTNQANGLLLYNGPMSEKQEYDEASKDYLAVYLVNGNVEVKFSLGGPDTTLQVKESPTVNDGNWHVIDIYRDKQEVELVLDKCRNVVTQGKKSSTVMDYTGCKNQVKVDSVYEQFNLVNPLQLGGVAPSAKFDYPDLPQKTGFIGCIRNLIVNDKLYDMNQVGMAENSNVGCAQTDDKCTSDGQNYCVHGECIASYNSRNCICDPGSYGERCDQKLGWVQFSSQSYINYKISAELSQTMADMQILFVSENDNGDLAKASNTGDTEYMTAAIDKRKVAYLYNFGGGAKNLTLNQVTLATNQSYWLHIQRYNSWAKISLDNLQGRFSKDIFQIIHTDDMALNYDRSGFYLGAESQSAQRDFHGCVRDFRWDNLTLPLKKSIPINASLANIVKEHGVSPGCTLLPTCASLPNLCSLPFVCVDFWKGPFCTCPPNLAPVTSDGILTGCNSVSVAVVQLGITGKAVAAILVCLVVLIMLVLILVVYSRRRRPIVYNVSQDDIRGDTINYQEQGGGEGDNDTYNISPLRKPVLPIETGFNRPLAHAPGPHPSDIENFLVNRLRTADDDPTAPPYDELREYRDEGDGLSRAGSLSSLSSSDESDVDMNEQVNNWGPRFRNLAKIYSGKK